MRVHVIETTSNPSVAPDFVGQHHINTTSSRQWLAKGTATVADWVEITADTGITQLTGDVTAGPGSGSQAATLATVNSNVGAFTNASLTVNAKGLITAASSGTAPVTSVGATSPLASSGGATPTISISTPITPALGGFGLSQLPTSIVKNTSSNVNNQTVATGFLVFSGSYGGGPWSLTGLVAQADGTELTISNMAGYGANTITISQESGSSTAANRFNFENSIPPQTSIKVRYSASLARWVNAGVALANATTSNAGLVSIGTQQFGGDKEFTTIKVNTAFGVGGVTPVTTQSTSGSTTGFSQNGGTDVYDGSTFAGSTGGTGYTIDDIVEALKKFGILGT